MFERVVSLVLVATTGCSYLLIDRPPRAVRKTDMMPGCTTELTWPVVDAVVGVIGVAGGIGIATGAIEPTADSMDPMGTMKRPLTSGEKFLAGSASIVEGLLFAWSAYHGYQATRVCRDVLLGSGQHAYYLFEPEPEPASASATGGAL